MNYDSRVANSNGFFRDPATLDELTGNEERVVQISITDAGKLIWPQVRFSDGSVGKIVYKLWTKEEKEIYKKYRELGKQRQSLPRPVKQVPMQQESQEQVTHSQVEYDEGSAMSAQTRQLLDQDLELVGMEKCKGLTYALLKKKGTNRTHWVPRGLIHDIGRYIA